MGHVTDPRLPVTGRLSVCMLSLLVEGIRLQRQIPDSRLITSEGRVFDPQPQVLVIRDAAVALGVESEFIGILDRSVNTMQEAIAYRSKFGKCMRLILVTSTVHMSRAVLLFRKPGLDPVSAPTGRMRRNLYGQVMHEYVVMVWVFIRF